MTSDRQDISISQLGVIEFLNCFSVLVVAGSVSTAYFFGNVFHTTLPLSFYWLLASTIWAIYTLDHILDGMKMKMQSVSIRHLIHYKYRKSILPGLTALVIFNAYVAWMFLPNRIIIAGVVVSVVVLLYFILVHYSTVKITKEFFVSIVVCVGMVVLPGLYGDLSFSIVPAVLIVTMVLINYSNLLLFSYFDYDSDVKNGLQSAATEWGEEKTKSVILYALGTGFFTFFCWLLLIQSPVKLIVSVAFLLMFNILLILYIQEERFSKDEQYRFWGDFIYLVPGLVWWLLSKQTFF